MWDDPKRILSQFYNRRVMKRVFNVIFSYIHLLSRLLICPDHKQAEASPRRECTLGRLAICHRAKTEMKNHSRSWNTDIQKSPSQPAGSNSEPFCCKATVLTSAPLCHPDMQAGNLIVINILKWSFLKIHLHYLCHFWRKTGHTLDWSPNHCRARRQQC